MKKGVFKPYTKENAITILRKYFNMTKEQAFLECERLSACVVRDGLDVAKYLYKWENKVLAGQKGDIKELYILYPYSTKLYQELWF